MCDSGGSETRYQTEPPKTSHRLLQPPSYVSVRPSATTTTTTTFIKKNCQLQLQRLFSFPFSPWVTTLFGKQAIVFSRRKYTCTYVRLLMIYASSIGCCAIEWGGTTENGARRKVGCLSSIVYRKLRRR